MKKLRIAQVTSLQESVPPLNQNGLEQLVYDLTEELIDLGHDVTVFGTADSKTRAKLIPIWPHAVTHQNPQDKLLDKQTYAMWSVAEAFIRQNEFDIIHSHAGFVAKHFAGALTIPLVSTEHNPVNYDFLSKFTPEYQEYFQEVEQKHFAYSHTVAISTYQAKCFNRPIAATIHNGIRLSQWSSATSTPGGYLAFLGYITKDKGVAEAIQAVLPTNEKLLIAGRLDDTTENQEYFIKEIKPYLSERIQFVGPMDFNSKQEFLKNAKATLMPIQWDEPFGLVAIESLACGTPVIAWNRAALPEIIEDNVSGYLVNSVGEMTARIGAINNLDRVACRKRVEDFFSATVMAKNYESLYYSLIK